MRVAIVGAGGVGGWIGAKLLHHADADVQTCFVLRDSSAQLTALQTVGLRYNAVEEGDVFFLPTSRVHCVTESEMEAHGTVDVVLLATKTYQIEGALEHLAPLVGPCVPRARRCVLSLRIPPSPG
jgi:2-dehydropantoate 2-reductase